jgi:hypothetical protein
MPVHTSLLRRIHGGALCVGRDGWQCSVTLRNRQQPLCGLNTNHVRAVRSGFVTATAKLPLAPLPRVVYKTVNEAEKLVCKPTNGCNIKAVEFLVKNVATILRRQKHLIAGWLVRCCKPSHRRIRLCYCICGSVHVNDTSILSLKMFDRNFVIGVWWVSPILC